MATTLHYNFATDKSLVPRIGPTLGIVRATEARYFDSLGVMQVAASGEARFDHNPITGDSLGLLVEEERENLCLQSEDLGTASWSQNGSASTQDDQTAPDGALTADTLIDSTLGTTGSSYVQQAITIVDATVYTWSGYFKAGTVDWVFFWMDRGTSNIAQYFDLANGLIGTGSPVPPDSSSIEDVGNGWYRCSVTGTSNGTGGNVRVMLAEADGDNQVLRDNTHSIGVWGLQLEAGAIPTSYIPTTTIAVTRDADEVSASDGTWYNSGGPGSFYWAASKPHLDTAFATIFSAREGASGRYGSSMNSATSSVQTSTGAAGSASVANAYVAGVLTKNASGMSLNDLTLYSDGVVTPTPDTTVGVPTGVDIFWVGSFNVGGNQVLNGHIAEILYDDTRIDNTTLEAWSTTGPSEPLSGILYPRDAMPTDEARFATFIAAAGGTTGVDITTDYRNALASILGYTETQALTRSVQDLFKEYFESL